MHDAYMRRQRSRKIIRLQRGPAGAVDVERIPDVEPARLRREHDEPDADAVFRQAAGQASAVRIVRQSAEEMRLRPKPAQADRNVIGRAAADRPQERIGTVVYRHQIDQCLAANQKRAGVAHILLRIGHDPFQAPSDRGPIGSSMNSRYMAQDSVGATVAVSTARQGGTIE